MLVLLLMIILLLHANQSLPSLSDPSSFVQQIGTNELLKDGRIEGLSGLLWTSGRTRLPRKREELYHILDESPGR